MQDSLFSYRYDKTIIHKIPAIIKLFYLCFVSIRIFSTQEQSTNYEPWILCCFYFLLNTIIFILGKTKLTSLKKLLFIPIIGLVITLIRGINFNEKYFFNHFELLEGLLYTTRLFISSFTALIVFDTTSIYQLENNLDKIPLFKKLKISQTISLTILFIPLIFRTWDKIKTATKSRTKNKNLSFIKKINILYQNLITLFASIINSAENIRKTILIRNKNNIN